MGFGLWTANPTARTTPTAISTPNVFGLSHGPDHRPCPRYWKTCPVSACHTAAPSSRTINTPTTVLSGDFGHWTLDFRLLFPHPAHTAAPCPSTAPPNNVSACVDLTAR